MLSVVGCILASCALAAANVKSVSDVFVVQSDLVRPYETMARWIRENTSEDAVIMCNQAPVLALLSNRLTYSYRFPRTPNIITKYDVDYVLIDAPGHPRFMTHLQSRIVRVEDIDMGDGERRSICRVRK